MQYRFKTLEEFEKEFEIDEHGRYRTSHHAVFTPSMHPLAGTEIDDKLVEEIHRLKRTSLSFNGKSFSIIPEMITPVKLPVNWYIQGSPELKNYFREIGEQFGGDCDKAGYFIDSTDSWVCKYIVELDSYSKISVDDYLRLKNVGKEIIGYKIKDVSYYKALRALGIVVATPIETVDYYMLKDNWGFLKERIEEEGLLDLWFEPIYDGDIKLPQIAGFSGSFNDGKLEYGCATLNPEWFRENSEFNRSIIGITLSSGVEIKKEQIEQIRKFLSSNGKE